MSFRNSFWSLEMIMFRNKLHDHLGMGGCRSQQCDKKFYHTDESTMQHHRYI